MRQNVFRLALCAMLFALCDPVQAQQAKKIPRIGYLSATSPSAEPARTDAFRQGLRELGYIEEHGSSPNRQERDDDRTHC